MADGSAGHPRAEPPADPGADRPADRPADPPADRPTHRPAAPPAALPPYLRPAAVATVAGGGALGSVLRWCATTLPGGGDLGPLLAVNVVGALLLGLLTTVLARSGPDTGLRRTLRLGLGTGGLGASRPTPPSRRPSRRGPRRAARRASRGRRPSGSPTSP
ncbi:hypothetical protein I6I09_07115 [Corynebacterium bovis]|uniref:hypothetical protein n=1 Tax=Corynebacterium bovis TaxID=36808 RepID=UPI0018E12901|nr:hypothetical protein [Corynebacterium bovis]QQC46878.1 hypothetical protein I6I09_07115 [Corynebacterium bovis]